MKQDQTSADVEKAVQLIGERWAILILDALVREPYRFAQLKDHLKGISANVLTQRLRELEERGLVKRKLLPKPASVQVYQATRWALEAKPIFKALGRWAGKERR